MAVATITLESSNGDSVVVSAPNDEFLDDDIILDTNPDGIYDTGFTVRTVSGAFEHGGRIVGESVPIREMILKGLDYLGIDMDWEYNLSCPRSTDLEVTKPTSKVHVYVIPTDEEMTIARDTAALAL